MSVFVVAEASACHDGDQDKAARLIELAADIGADACKFQWLSSPERLVERRRAPEYLIAYRDIAFPRDWLPALKRLCDEAGIEFMVTVYVKRWKLASFENQDEEMLDRLNAYQQPVYVSAGMLDEEEAVWRSGAHENVELLHCVSAYPVPIEQINLGVLHGGSYVGLSDHTRHPLTGALAVAAGATIIEFHVRLDDTDPANADYLVARTPAEAVDYVAHIRLAEQMLGDGVKRVMACEEPMLRYRVRPA